MKKIVISLLSVSFCLFACDDSETNESQTLCGNILCVSGQTCVNNVCVDNTTPKDLCGGVECGVNQTCVNNVCVDNTTPKDLCGGVECGVSQTCVNNVCVDNTTPKDLCGGVECGVNQTCVNNVCVDNTTPKDLCGGVECGVNQTCVNNVCVDNTGNCSANARKCETDLQPVMCIGGAWQKIAACSSGTQCVDGECKSTALSEDEAKLRQCGTTKCTGNQLCQNGQCVERNSAMVAGKPCDPKTFLESCEGDSLVYCYVDPEGVSDPVTAVTKCENGAKCALRIDKNFGICVREDPACKAPGTFTFCFDQGVGAVSYLDYRECAMATDGKYYPFRMEFESTDCIGSCIDAYTCDEVDNLKSCTYGTSQSYCDGTTVVYCGDDSKYHHMACSDYDIGCVNTAEGADCDWDNMNL